MAKPEEFAKLRMNSYGVIGFLKINFGKEISVLNECAGRPHVFHFEMCRIEKLIQGVQVENKPRSTVGFGQYKERG